MKTYEVEVGLRGEGYSKRTVTVKAIDMDDAVRRAKAVYMLSVEARVLTSKPRPKLPLFSSGDPTLADQARQTFG